MSDAGLDTFPRLAAPPLPAVDDAQLAGPKLTVVEAAAVAGVSRDKVERWIAAGELAAVNCGTANRACYRIPRDALLTLLRGRLAATVRRGRRLASATRQPPAYVGTHTKWRRNREGHAQRDR